jgi:hypothetical protein
MRTAKDDDFRYWFYDLGTQYYVAGRSVARAGLNPVYGNLLHHAVEMFLRGVLVGPLKVEKLRTMRHNLPQLWEAYRTEEKDTALSRFDSTIVALHAFESIRYPDKIVAKGMLATIVWAPRHVTTASASVKQPPKYEVIINHIDELIIVLLRRASVNPKFFVKGMHGFGSLEALTYQSPEAAHWFG